MLGIRRMEDNTALHVKVYKSKEYLEKDGRVAMDLLRLVKRNAMRTFVRS